MQELDPTTVHDADAGGASASSAAPPVLAEPPVLADSHPLTRSPPDSLTASAPPGCGDSPSAPPPRLHDLPLPITWDLCGALRRLAQPPLADTLFSIFDEAVCRSMLHESLPEDGRPQRAVERWIRTYASLRREWLEVAHDAVGCAGITPLRVEALALARATALRMRWDPATRSDMEFALGEAGRVLSAYGVFVRERPFVDHRRLRLLSSRFDYCVAASLLAGTDPCFAGLRTATPLLCAEARIAVAELRRMVEPLSAARAATRSARPRRSAKRGAGAG